ncbi:hypothetical protein OWV82_005305 [Melia azedarach]|uniref:Uncharacterized protein n=1 Tax=Melia azedarach TaxID=155640 RepID=A0ACC1YT35_MELAZ|nr:hypothetical protein OWV82_005305 [Melia azedarach]
MAILAMITGAVFVAILVIYLTIERQKDSELEESDFRNNGEENEINIPEPDLDFLETHSQPNLPSEGEYELPPNLEELAKTTTENQLTVGVVCGRTAVRSEAEAEKYQKNGLKIACLVISVSSTGIVSFLVGFSANKPATRNKLLLFKAVVFSMCSSLFSALILLILSTINLNFSLSFLAVRIFIWISTALMTFGIVLLIVFYFHLA